MNNFIKTSFRPILKKIERYKDIHHGESCYLFGDGISVKYFNLKNFNDKISIPCGFLLFHNDFDELHSPYAMLIESYYFYLFTRLNKKANPRKKISINSIQRQYRLEINKRRNVDFFVSLTNYPVLFDKNITYFYKDIPDHSLKKDFIANRFNCFEGSLRAQIMLAIYMGFNKVFLVGHDYTHSPAKSHHWYEKGHGVITPMDNFSKEFLEYAKNFIDITTVTVDSEAANLNHVKYEKLFNQPPKFKENYEILASNYLNVFATQPYNIF